MEDYDVIIIGAGPGGMMAAVYSARYMLRTLIIGEFVGGMAGEADRICNFPTYSSISGFDFVEKMKKQVESVGVEIKQEKIKDVSGKDGEFTVKTLKKVYKAKKIIIATGTAKRKLNVAKEDEFLGKGISYCATCDAGFYKNKIVGVVGGGNSGLSAALLISEFAKKVYIFHKNPKFNRAEPAWIEDIKANGKMEVLFSTEITKILGEKKVEGVELKDGKEITLEGLFIEIGSEPNTRDLEKLKLKLENEYIKTDRDQRTNVNGVFAVGDVTNSPLKQMVTACSDGAIAATSIYKELKGV